MSAYLKFQLKEIKRRHCSLTFPCHSSCIISKWVQAAGNHQGRLEASRTQYTNIKDLDRLWEVQQSENPQRAWVGTLPESSIASIWCACMAKLYQSGIYSLSTLYLLWQEWNRWIYNRLKKLPWSNVKVVRSGYWEGSWKVAEMNSRVALDQIFSIHTEPPPTRVRWEDSQHVKKANLKIPGSKRIDLLRTAA